MPMPVVTAWVENRGATVALAVPVTDGKRIFTLRADINEAYNSGCRSIVKEWHKAVLLVSIDELWKEHLRELDDLRQSVQNASYEQKDPLVIYKVESFHLFENMLNNLNTKSLSALMRGQIYVRREPQTSDAVLDSERRENEASRAAAAARASEAADRAEAALAAARAAAAARPELHQAAPERRNDYSQYTASKENLPGEAANRAASAGASKPSRPQPIKAQPRVGRNDPCPCGSGKKYKNCHGRNL